MTTTHYVLIALVMVLFALGPRLLALAQMKSGEKMKKGEFTSRHPLTANEQAMFWRLAEAFPLPNSVVFSQVSFGALLNAKNGASRYSFSQKRADFVVFDKAFQVRAVVELDDSSHRGRHPQDQQRDSMLQEAGYRVLRYKGIPDTSRLRNDIPVS